MLEDYPEAKKWFKNVEQNHNGAKFFKYHDYNFGKFWNHFTFNEIMTMATIDEYAAYTILQENYAEFRTFCNLAWNYDVLDLSLARVQTLEGFKFICKMFPKPKEIILPEDIFPGILHHLSRFTNISFHLSKKSLFKKAFHPYRVNTLKIFGPIINGDSVVAPIFDTFRNIDRVEIHKANFSANIFERFFYKSPKSLIIRDMDIDWFDELQMAANILKLKQLEELTIEYSGHCNNTQETIEFILRRIHYLKNLKVFKINLELTEENIKCLKSIKNIDIKVYTFLGPNEPDLYEAYEIFKNTKIEIIDIRPEIEPDEYEYPMTPDRVFESEEDWPMDEYFYQGFELREIIGQRQDEFRLEFEWNEHVD